MKLTFRERLTWLHTWAGLVVGWLLFAIFLTGSLAVFALPITHWMQPEARPGRASPEQSIAIAQGYLRREAAGAESWSIDLPTDRHPALRVAWIQGFDDDDALLDPATGRVLQPRATEGGEFYNRVHYELYAGVLGLWVVGFAGSVLFIAAVSGVIIHKRIFADIFTFRPRAAPQRAWLDGHNVAGVLTLPFLLMIAYTGVSLSYAQFMPAGVNALYEGNRGAPDQEIVQTAARPASGQAAATPDLPALLVAAEQRLGAGQAARVTVFHPGDAAAVFAAHRRSDNRIADLAEHVALDAATGRELLHQNEWPAGAVFHRTLSGLHFGAFGGWTVAWLYFLSGLTGCVLVAAGLTVFVEKRRKKRAQAAPLDRSFQALAERVNVAAVAGPLLAAIAFLWGNRLIPAELLMREEWENRVFFATWAAAFAHAMARPPRKAWIEQLGLAAALCIGLPALNAATSDTGLSRAIAAGDWMSAGVDLTALILGLALAAIAARLLRRSRA